MSDLPAPPTLESIETAATEAQHASLTEAITRFRAGIPSEHDPKAGVYYQRPDLVARYRDQIEAKISEISAKAGYAAPAVESPEARADRILAEAYDPGEVGTHFSELAQADIDKWEKAGDSDRTLQMAHLVRRLGEDAAWSRFHGDPRAPYPGHMRHADLDALGKAAYQQLVTEARAGSNEELPRGCLHSLAALKVLAVAGRANAAHQRALATRRR